MLPICSQKIADPLWKSKQKTNSGHSLNHYMFFVGIFWKFCPFPKKNNQIFFLFSVSGRGLGISFFTPRARWGFQIGIPNPFQNKNIFFFLWGCVRGPFCFFFKDQVKNREFSVTKKKPGNNFFQGAGGGAKNPFELFQNF